MGVKFNPITGNLDWVSETIIGGAVVSGTSKRNLFINQSGNLDDVMDATLDGILYDGNTNPYTGEQASVVVNAFSRTIGSNDGNPVSPILGSFSLTNNNVASLGSGLTIQNTAVYGLATVNGAYNTEAIDDIESNYGGFFDVQRSGIISGDGNLVISNYGLYSRVISNTSYTATDAQSPKDYGLFINMSATTSGTPGPTHTAYGIYISQSMTGLGDATTAYGVYAAGIDSGGDGDAWFLYCVPDVASYFRGDISINSTTASAQLNQIIDSSVRIGHRIVGAASQSVHYLTVLTSGLADVFSIGPNTSASVATMHVHNNFDSSDSLVARFQGPDRATAVNFDRASIEFYLDNSAGTQSHFAELEFVAQAVSSSGRYGGLFFNTEVNSSNINILALGQSASGGVGFLVNNSKIDMDVRFNTVVTTGTFYIDGGLDAIQFTPTTTRASAAGATWNGFNIQAATATVTGTTQITTATGFNLVNISRPTITDSSSVIIDHAATVYIANAPLAAGSVTLSAPYALWIDDGNVRIDGAMTLNGAVRIDGTFGIGVTPVGRDTGWSVTNVTTDKDYDANAASVDILADVLGSLIAALTNNGILSA